MKNLEICKRIAEIEGLTVADDDVRTQFNVIGFWVVSDVCTTGDEPWVRSITEHNPLTDDALCFQLMVKYKIEFIPSWQEVRSDGRKPYGAYKVGGDHIVCRSKSPNRAVCLAIIAAH